MERMAACNRTRLCKEKCKLGENERKRQQRVAQGSAKPGDEEPAEGPKLQIQTDYAGNFLRLAVAFGRTVRVADPARAKGLLFDYLEGYHKAYSHLLALYLIN